MDIGCHLPVYGPAATREALTLFARRAEALGYDSLWVSDHVVIPYTIRSRYPYNATGDFPLSPVTDFLEPLTVMALVAGVTSKIRLGTSVLVLPHRHPVLTAKMLATIDHLAPGRVILVRSGTIPKTSSGKIQHSRLVQMIQDDSLDERVVYGDD